MTSDVGFVLIVVVFIIGTGFAARVDGQAEGQAIICAEIDWHSPTCEKIKKERLTP